MVQPSSSTLENRCSPLESRSQLTLAVLFLRTSKPRLLVICGLHCCVFKSVLNLKENIGLFWNRNIIQIVIEYETASQCSGLQWLDKDQTAGKKLPYVFSQCEVYG
jgi:hypothetical protein